MDELLNDLLTKNKIQLDTLKDVIEVTDNSKYPHEIAKYKSVCRFLVGFKADLLSLKKAYEAD